jgi:hypothetical protein
MTGHTTTENTAELNLLAGRCELERWLKTTRDEGSTGSEEEEPACECNKGRLVLSDCKELTTT